MKPIYYTHKLSGFLVNCALIYTIQWKTRSKTKSTDVVHQQTPPQMLMESTIESQQWCVFTSSVLISLWAFLFLFLQTPPLDLLVFLCSSVTSSGSLSGFPSNSFSFYPAKTLPQTKLKLYQWQYWWTTWKVKLWKHLIPNKHSPSNIAHHV